MASYMEGYGAGEETRNRIIKRTFLIGVPAILLAVGGFFYFRTWSQERAIGRFVDALEQQKYEDAYQMWCTAAKPCRFYPLDKFKEDWGPQGHYGKVSDLKFGAVDYCKSGVVFEVETPTLPAFGLWVERETNLISFAPWQRCPGKHLQFSGFFDRMFGSSAPPEPPAIK
jgi:hypothetical protein